MKTCVTFGCIALLGFSVFGQGTVNFSNVGGQKVMNNQTGTPVEQPVNPNILFALYAGPQGTLEANLVEVSVGNRATIDSLPGVFSSLNSVSVASVAPGATGTFQVRAWDQTFGATYEQFLISAPETAIRGVSSVFDNQTGGVGMPPGLPANLTGFPGLTLVPEPSTYALGAMGLGALAFLRRRKA